MNDELNEFLFRHGLAARGAAIAWTPLPGGVASDIWRVDVPPRSLCVKRALGTLKVAAHWQVPTTRNAYEWAWIRYASLHAPGAVPAPLYWYYISLDDKSPDSESSGTERFEKARHYWRKLPLIVTKIIGPSIRKHISL